MSASSATERGQVELLFENPKPRPFGPTLVPLWVFLSSSLETGGSKGMPGFAAQGLFQVFAPLDPPPHLPLLCQPGNVFGWAV